MKIEIGPSVLLAPRDTVLLASDGVFDNLHMAEAIECVRKGTLEDAAGRLATSAKNRMNGDERTQPSKPDDLTFILFRSSSGHLASAPL
jgi:serine/threonine protein phosphatase PrpC